MSDETFDETDDEEPELDDVVDDEELVLDEDLELADDPVDGENPPEVVDPVAKGSPSSDRKADDDKTDDDKTDDDEDVLELEDEHHPDDVEDPLDVLLQERTASASLEDEEEDVVEEIDVDERGEGPTKIVPRRPGEFLCASCFLVLPRAQLADEQRMLCRDCA